MQRFNKVLLIAEGHIKPESNPAVRHAMDLAKRNGASITVFDVVKFPDRITRDNHDIVSMSDLFELVIEQRKNELQELAKGLQQQDVDVAVKVLSGRGFIEAVREIIHQGHDVVIKVAGRKRTAFSGNDFHLMRKCPCPVWILKEDRDFKKPQRILAAIDLALEADDEGRAFNNLIMDLATSLASWHNSEVHLLSCWTLYGENALRRNPFLKVPEDKLNFLLNQEQKSNQQRFEKLLQRYQSFDIKPHLCKGYPEKIILSFANENNIDMAVMGTIGRSGIPGFLIGNTAEIVLQSIDTSVITVKPDGFVSPVE